MQELERNIKELNNLPNELKDLRIWLNYNANDKNPKRPFRADGLAGNIKEGPLNTFNECIESIKKGTNTGLGLVVNASIKGLCFIDYDNCLTGIKVNDAGLKEPIFKDADTEQRILKDINLIKSYTEVSPSGKGIHIYLMTNNLLDIGKKTENIEIYTTGRFMRCTGNRLFDYDIEVRTKELEDLCKSYFEMSQDLKEVKHNLASSKKSIYQMIKRQFDYDNHFTDKQVLDAMFKSKQGEYLKRLYYNELTDKDLKDRQNKRINRLYDLSNSGLSLTLIMHLYYFCYGDIKAVKRLFKNSGLCKEKYLKLNYDNHKADLIDYEFIPKAILYYKNFKADNH